MCITTVWVALCDIYKPFLASKIIDLISQTQDPMALRYERASLVLWQLIALYVSSAFAWLLTDISIVLFDRPLRMNCLQEAVTRLYDYPHRFFQDHLTGSIASRISVLFEQTSNLVFTLIYDGLHFLLYFLFSLSLIASIAPEHALNVLLYGGGFIAIIALTASKQHRLTQRVVQHKATLIGHVSDYVANMFAVRSFARKKYEHDRIENEGQTLLQVGFEEGFHITKTYLVIHIFTTFSLGWILYHLLISVSKEEISAGSFAFIFMAMFNLINLLYKNTFIWRHFSREASTVDQASKLLEEKPLLEHPSAQPLTKIEQITPPKITFDEIRFDYRAKNQENKIFELALSLVVEPREKIGLVGYSGGGKSTLLHLLQRFYTPSSGTILWDEHYLEELQLDSLRNAISYIPQDPTLFHRSIAENIRYGKPSACDSEVIEAAKKAQAHHFIRDIGYETLVGERGVKLSGGQRQRVAIARAFLKDAPLLLVDEATSQLDSHTEALLQESFALLMGNKTTIVIAHRLATLSSMDRLVLLSEGKIIEEGVHADLVSRKSGNYKKLWDAQVGGLLPQALSS